MLMVWLSVFIILHHSIRVYSRRQYVELPQNRLSRSCRDVYKPVIKLSNLPTLLPKYIIFPRDFFARTTPTKQPKLILSKRNTAAGLYTPKGRHATTKRYATQEKRIDSNILKSVTSRKFIEESTERLTTLEEYASSMAPTMLTPGNAYLNYPAAFVRLIRNLSHVDMNLMEPNRNLIHLPSTSLENKNIEPSSELSTVLDNIHYENSTLSLNKGGKSAEDYAKYVDYFEHTTIEPNKITSDTSNRFPPSTTTNNHVISSTSITPLSETQHLTSRLTSNVPSTTPVSSPSFSFKMTPLKIRISNLTRKSRLSLVAVGRKLYHLETKTKMNFLGAFHFCRRHNMELLSIETKDEEDAITNFLKESNVSEVWTSGTDLAEEGKFVWLSTGKTFDYNAWGPNQPDNTGSIEDCVQVVFRHFMSSSFAWEDVICDLPAYFVCEVASCSDFCINNGL